MTLATTLERAGGYTVVAGTAAAVVWMFTQFAPIDRVNALELMHKDFVTSSEFQEYVTEEYYEKYYLVLDRVRRARERNNEDLAVEMERTLERIRAKICKEDPEWERCGASG